LVFSCGKKYKRVIKEEKIMVEVDARGFSCPIPVVKIMHALENNPGEPVTILVDSEVSRENVSRLAQSKGYTVEIEALAEGYKLILNPQ
jgi:tRNA 2-thiouridine synthesizing protein A